MLDSRKERAERFAEMHARARLTAGKSQEYMAYEMGIAKKTVQNWERGKTSPTFFQSLEWFRILKINPTPLYFRMMFPDEKQGISPEDSDAAIDSAFNDFTKNLSIDDKRALLYLYLGGHGSSPHSVIQLLLAHLHTPIRARITNAVVILNNYQIEKQRGGLICPKNISPDIDNLNRAVNRAQLSAIENRESYFNID